MSSDSNRKMFGKGACFHFQVKGWGAAYSAGSHRSLLDSNRCDEDDDDDDDDDDDNNNNNNTNTLRRRSQQRIFIIGLHMGNLFTTCFCRNESSSGTTHIKKY